MFILASHDERLEGQFDLSCLGWRRKHRWEDMVQLSPALWREGAALLLKKSVLDDGINKPVHFAQRPTQRVSQLTLADFRFGLGNRAQQYRFLINLVFVADREAQMAMLVFFKVRDEVYSLWRPAPDF